MKIKPFAVEEWMNAYEDGARYNIAETCVDSVSLDELFLLAGEDKQAFLERFCARRLTYGDIVGSEALREGVCGLYKSLKPDEVIPTHGAAGANYHVFCSLISPGDGVVSIMPAYQQLYSIPEAIGADVRLMHLRQENGYLPDLAELKSLVDENTKLICVNNPNNPTGALMSRELLERIIEVARSVDAYVLCDEVYRNLTQEDGWCESIVDLYEKGISVSSMSKVFSLAGLRMGWIATHDKQALRAFLSHRDYNLIKSAAVCLMMRSLLSLFATRTRFCTATGPSCARISRFWTRGFRKIRIFTTPSPRPAQRRWSITILTCRLMSSASGSTTKRARSSRPATALSSPGACALATPATKRRWKTALPRWQGLRKRSAETKSPASRQEKIDKFRALRQNKGAPAGPDAALPCTD